MFGIKAMGMNSFHRLRLLLPPPTGQGTRSARPRGLGGLEPCARCAGKSMAEIGNRKERLRDYASFPDDFEFTALKGRSRVSTLHPELYKNLREGARRVIGATAKPLYPIDGKAGRP